MIMHHSQVFSAELAGGVIQSASIQATAPTTTSHGGPAHQPATTSTTTCCGGSAHQPSIPATTSTTISHSGPAPQDLNHKLEKICSLLEGMVVSMVTDPTSLYILLLSGKRFWRSDIASALDTITSGDEDVKTITNWITHLS